MNPDWFFSYAVYFKHFHIEKLSNPGMFLTGSSSVSMEVKHKKLVLPYIEVRAEERDGTEGGM